MNGMKYIIFDNGLFDEPFIFSAASDHAEIARTFNLKRTNILSAGFVTIDDNGLYAYGCSTGLNINSRVEDTQIIKKMLE